MVEYALILAAVAIIAVVAIWGSNVGDVSTDNSTSLKSAVSNAFSNAASKINAAGKN